MKKLYFLAAFAFGLLTTVSSQDLVVGGDMESAASWSILDLGAGDGHTETFGYNSDRPLGGAGGCLRCEGAGNWSSVAVYQEITVTRGTRYKISMVVKTAMDFEANNHWTEVVIIDSVPAEDGDITAFPNSLALNTWDCPDVLSVDGDFRQYNCDAKSELYDIFTIEGTGDTTIVLVLKVGGGTAYDVLLDNVSIVETTESSVQTASNSSLDIFPNPIENELNIRLASQIQEVNLVNLMGQTVKTFNNLSADEVSLDVSGIKAGIYFIVVRDVNGKIDVSKSIKL